MAYTSRQAQLVTSAYQRYLHRTPSGSEIQREVDEAARRGENESQWQQRIDRFFAGQQAPPAPAAPAPPDNPYVTDRGGEPAYQAPAPPIPSAAPPPTVARVGAGGKVEVVPNPDTGAVDPKRLQFLIDNPPVQQHAGEGESATVDPYAIERAQMAERINKEARFVPGAAPNVAIIKDGTVIDLRTGLPAKDLDSVSLGFAKLAHDRYNVLPKYADYEKDVRGAIFGRPLEYRGDPSAEEQALTTRFLAGDKSAAGPLAKMRMSRLAPRERPAADAIMRPLSLAATALMLGATMGPLAAGIGPLAAGGIGGAFGGGVTSTVASGGDPKASLLGAGTGAVGGALGAGVTPGLTAGLGGGIPGAAGAGAITGATGAGVKAGLTAALGGEVDPWDLVTAALAGGVSGGAKAGLTNLATTQGSDPQGIGDFRISPDKLTDFFIKLGSSQLGSQAAQGLAAFLPEGRTGLPIPEPDGSFPAEAMAKDMRDAQAAEQETQFARQKEMLSQRGEAQNAAVLARKVALQDAMDKYNAQRDAALQEHNTKLAEAQSARSAALERLRNQAASYLAQVQSARQAPLPAIPVAVGPAPLAPPDPFDPSSALAEQTFGGDFPVSQGAASSSGDFPVSTAEAPSTAAPSIKQSTLKQMPLNIQQIQAALAARRR